MQASAAGSYNKTHVFYASWGFHKKVYLATSLVSDPFHNNHLTSSDTRERFIIKSNQFTLLKNIPYWFRSQGTLDYCQVIRITGILVLLYLNLRPFLVIKRAISAIFFPPNLPL